MRLRTIASSTFAVAAIALTAVSTPAQAASVAAGTPAQAAPTHCVANVAQQKAPVRCYGTFTEAIAQATGGRVTDAPRSARGALDDARLVAELDASGSTKAQSSSITAVSVLISIEYWDDGFSGSTYTWTAPAGCTGTTADTDWQAASLASNWNDEIGSYRGFSNCWVRHFEHINFGGIFTAYDGGLADMGWMDDESSSLRWS